MTNDRYTQLCACLDNFDFERVRDVMVRLDWKWAQTSSGVDMVPSVSDLHTSARRLIEYTLAEYERCNDPSMYTNSGGFCVWVLPESILLQFVVTDWDSND